jgi:hypothetical protein
MWSFFTTVAAAAAPHEVVHVEIYLFDAAGGVFTSAEGDALCNPCTLTLGPNTTRAEWPFEDLALAVDGTFPADPGLVQVVVLSDSPDVWPSIEPLDGPSAPFDLSLTWAFVALPSGRVYGPALPFAPEASEVGTPVGTTGASLVIHRAW